MTWVCVIDEHGNRRRLAPSCPRQAKGTIRILMITFQRMKEKNIACLEDIQKNHLIAIKPHSRLHSKLSSFRLYQHHLPSHLIFPEVYVNVSNSSETEKLLGESNDQVMDDEGSIIMNSCNFS